MAKNEGGSAYRRLTLNELIQILHSIFVGYGTSLDVAKILATNCALAERDGSDGHGVFRIPGYVSTLQSGYVDGRAEAIIDTAAGAFIRVDACNGFAQSALSAVSKALTAAAQSQGVAIAAIKNSHHFGALWLDVEPFARAGFIAIACVNSVARVVPHNGNRPVYGTNPIAFATPRHNDDPLVFDQATSALAFGEIRLAAKRGERLPSGCGVDRHGAPTSDASEILNGGSLLPFGGYKGASISMMVELLSAALTGGNFSTEVSTQAFPGAQTSKTGELVIVIDPSHGGGTNFAQRVTQLCCSLRDSGQDRLPGDRRLQRRRESDRLGIALSEEEFHMLEGYQQNARSAERGHSGY